MVGPSQRKKVAGGRAGAKSSEWQTSWDKEGLVGFDSEGRLGIPLPNCLLEAKAPKALLWQGKVLTPTDKRDADKSPGTDGSRPGRRVPLKGEIAAPLAKNLCTAEGMWVSEPGFIDRAREARVLAAISAGTDLAPNGLLGLKACILSESGRKEAA